MRTKTLLLTAALSVAGIATSSAQSPVYSVNAVGYVNTPLVKGFNLVANPLNNKATGGNQIKNLFATVPPGSQIYRFNTTTAKFDIGEVDEFGGGITGPIADQELLPGEGVFILSAAAGTVTFVGEVPAGDLVNQIPKGLSIRASQVPQAGKATTDLKFPVVDGDQVYVFNEATQQYGIFGYDFGAWDNNTEPTIEVGEAIFVNKVAAVPWTRSFSISQ